MRKLNTVSTLERTSSFFNPSFFNGYQVERIIFFDPNKGEKITDAKWFGSGSNNDYKKMSFGFEIKNRRKTDLTRNEAFYTSSTYKYKSGATIDIFVPISFVQFKELGEVERYSNENGTQYENKYSFIIDSGVKIDCTYNKKLDKLVYFDKDVNNFTIEFTKHSRFVKSAKGKKAARIYDKVKHINSSLSEYDINKMLDVLNMSVRRV